MRVALGIPVGQVQDKALAVGFRQVDIGIPGIGFAEVFLPVAPPVQIVGIEQGVPGLVSQQLHAGLVRATFHLQHEFTLQLLQARMGEEERDGDTRDAVRTVPLIRQPEVRPEYKTTAAEFMVQLADPGLELTAVDTQTEVANAQVEEFFLRPFGPAARWRFAASR